MLVGDYISMNEIKIIKNHKLHSIIITFKGIRKLVGIASIEAYNTYRTPI